MRCAAARTASSTSSIGSRTSSAGPGRTSPRWRSRSHSPITRQSRRSRSSPHPTPCATKRFSLASSLTPQSLRRTTLPFPFRTIAWSGSPTSRRRATSPSSTPCPPRLPTKCRRLSWLISPSTPKSALTCAAGNAARNEAALQRLGPRAAGHGALRPLLDPLGALVARKSLFLASGEVQAEKRRNRWSHRLELHAGARHRHRLHPAHRRLAALARPRAARRRERRRCPEARRARRAVGRRADRGLPRRRHQPCRFVSPDARQLQPVRSRRGLPLWRRRPERELCVSHCPLHAHLRREARGLRQAVRGAARQRPALRAGSLQEGTDPRGLSQGATDRRAPAPLRLRDALRRSGGISCSISRKGKRPEAAVRALARHDRAA